MRRVTDTIARAARAVRSVIFTTLDSQSWLESARTTVMVVAVCFAAYGLLAAQFTVCGGGHCN